MSNKPQGSDFRLPERDGDIIDQLSCCNGLGVHQRQLVSHLWSALNALHQGVVMYDKTQNLIFCNEPFARMYGLDVKQLKPGISRRSIIEQRIANGIFGNGDPRAYLKQNSIPVTCASDTLENLSDGRSIMIRRRPMQNGAWVATHVDHTDSVKMENRISHMARHDALTGLPNRTELNDRLALELARVRRGEMLALLSLDLDSFKDINDTYGPCIGDALLKQVAKRVQSSIREMDVAARLGGDEFVVLQCSIQQASDASVLAYRILEAIKGPYKIGGNIIAINSSIGVSIATEAASDPNILMKYSNLALYQAKADGRGAVRFFEPKMNAQMMARKNLELGVRQAIANQEFLLNYQPIVNLGQGRVTGMEALLRWQHPDKGLIPPLDFIPLAEETGLINQIGEWVLASACADAVNWPDHISLAINMSAAQFKGPDPLKPIRDAIERSGIAACRVEIEITESLLFDDHAATVDVLRELKSLGVKLSLDDFGTGYSSLSYLRNFLFDKIKLDRSFVKELPAAGKSLAILRSVAGLGRSLGMATTAEGVETLEQLGIVRDEGFSEVQGYFFSAPCSIDACDEVIRECDRKAATLGAA